MAALRHHHRVEDDRDAGRRPAEGVGHGLDDVEAVQHADLDAVGADVGEHHLDLAKDEVRRHVKNGGDARGVLRGQRRHRRRGIAAEGGDRLDVRLDAGTAAGIGTGDDEDAAAHRPPRRAQAATARIAVQISSTTTPMRDSSSPSAITRITGSVPEGRMRSRPLLPRRRSPSLIAC